MYDGKRSDSFNICNVSINSGLYEEPFVSSRSLVETSIKGNDKPYLNWIKPEPLVLDLAFAFLTPWDDDSIQDVKEWLSQNYYKPLIFSDDVDRLYYCVLISDPKILHNGLCEGYCTLQFRCDGAYSYSPVYIDYWDLSDNTNSIIKEVKNLSKIECKPTLEIIKIDAGDFTINNLSNGNAEFKFTGLLNNEIITVNNDSRRIDTNNPGTYRYDTFNDNYLSLPKGINRLKITGKCKINIKYQFKFL